MLKNWKKHLRYGATVAEIQLLDLSAQSVVAGEVLVGTGAGTAAWQKTGVILSAPDISGTVTAAAALTMPTFTLGGAIDASGQSISNINALEGRTNNLLQVANRGVASILYLDSRRTFANQDNAILVRTFNASDIITNRLAIQGGVDTAIMSFSGSSLYNMVLGNALDANGQNLDNVNSILDANSAQVVGTRVVDARCDDALNSGDATTDGVIDSLRDAMITHGLVAAT